jgi:hypothetical protein
MFLQIAFNIIFLCFAERLRAPFLVYWMNSRAPQTLPPWGSFLWGEFCKPKETKAGFRSERRAMLRAPVHIAAIFLKIESFSVSAERQEWLVFWQ